MKPKKLSKIAAGTILALSLLGGKANSQEPNSNFPLIQEEAVIDENFKPKIDLSFEFETGKNSEKIDYSLEDYLDNPDFNLVDNSIISKLLNKSISSYQSLIENAKPLTDNQKLVLLSFISNKIYAFDYDLNYNGEAYSQDVFFNYLQDTFDYETNSIGVCRHIASHIEQLANDMGLRAAAVTGSWFGTGHVYDLIKTDEGTSIVNGYLIFSSNSKNIEKVLAAYQKDSGSIMFQHLFFEDSKLKYKLITKDGENFLDVINYDSSLKDMKDSLINEKNSLPKITLEVTKNDDFLSSKLDLLGLYINAGVLKENLSPEEKINILQLGFKRKLTLAEKFGIYFSLSSVDGLLDGGELYGVNGKLIVCTENKKGLNFSSELSGALINMRTDIFNDSPVTSTLYSNLALNEGISYTLKLGDTQFEPYILSQFSSIIKDLGTYKPKLGFNELETGLKFSSQIGNTNFSLEPNYTKRIWENELGASVRIEAKHFGLNLEGYLTKSGYDFCPDKKGLSAGLDISINPISLKLGYKTDTTDYDGEIETIPSFSFTGKVELK